MGHLQAGDQQAAGPRTTGDAWAEVVRLCRSVLYAWLRRQGVQDADAEDLLGEVLATVARELPAFRDNGHAGAFPCWLRRALLNRLRTFRRAQRAHSICRSDTPLLDRLAEVLAGPDGDPARQGEEHDRSVARRAMERAEAAFDPQTWRAFRRTAVEGADPARVAGELGLSLASVYAAKSRVLKRLRREAGLGADSPVRNRPLRHC
jgi:RNA polymerase sigma-70 factor (ECF subfamily)